MVCRRLHPKVEDMVATFVSEMGSPTPAEVTTCREAVATAFNVIHFDMIDGVTTSAPSAGLADDATDAAVLYVDREANAVKLAVREACDVHLQALITDLTP